MDSLMLTCIAFFQVCVLCACVGLALARRRRPHPRHRSGRHPAGAGRRWTAAPTARGTALRQRQRANPALPYTNS